MGVNKKLMVNSIMKNVKHELTSVLNENTIHEDILLTEDKSEDCIIIEISSRKDTLVSSVKKVLNLPKGIKSEQGTKSLKVFCNKAEEVSSVMSAVTTAFDKYDDIIVKVYKKGKSGINDSVNESADVIEGDFQTTYSYSIYNNEVDRNMTPERAAKLHAKYLIKHGLTVELEEKRYNILYHIHYVGKAQFDVLVRWVAWDFGYTETINNKPSEKIIAEISEIIRSGKA